MKNPRIALLFVAINVILWVLLALFTKLGLMVALVGGMSAFLLGILAVWTGFYATVIAIYISLWAALLLMLSLFKSCTEAFVCAFAGVPYFFMFALISLLILITGIGLDIAKMVKRNVNGKTAS